MNNRRIKLNVGGVRYEVFEASLCKFPDTLLGSMFSSENKAKCSPDENNEYFFDRNGRLFEIILDYYRLGKLRIPPTTPLELLVDELEYFKIDYTDVMKSMQQPKLKPRAIDLDGFSSEEEEEEEEEEEDEEELEPEDIELARLEGPEKMFSLAVEKVWGDARRTEIRKARMLLEELIQASQIYAEMTPLPIDNNDETAVEAADLLRDSEALKVTSDVAKCLFPLAFACYRLGDTRAAEVWLDRAVAVLERTDEKAMECFQYIPTVAVKTLQTVIVDARVSGVKLLTIASGITLIVGSILYWKYKK